MSTTYRISQRGQMYLEILDRFVSYLELMTCNFSSAQMDQWAGLRQTGSALCR